MLDKYNKLWNRKDILYILDKIAPTFNFTNLKSFSFHFCGKEI